MCERSNAVGIAAQPAKIPMSAAIMAIANNLHFRSIPPPAITKGDLFAILAYRTDLIGRAAIK